METQHGNIAMPEPLQVKRLFLLQTNAAGMSNNKVLE